LLRREREPLHLARMFALHRGENRRRNLSHGYFAFPFTFGVTAGGLAVLWAV
jgi:hypothetical protein